MVRRSQLSGFADARAHADVADDGLLIIVTTEADPHSCHVRSLVCVPPTSSPCSMRRPKPIRPQYVVAVLGSPTVLFSRTIDGEGPPVPARALSLTLSPWAPLRRLHSLCCPRPFHRVPVTTAVFWPEPHLTRSSTRDNRPAAKMNTGVVSSGATVDAPAGPAPSVERSGAVSTTAEGPPGASHTQAAAVAAAEAAAAAVLASQVDAPLVTPVAAGSPPQAAEVVSSRDQEQ